MTGSDLQIIFLSMKVALVATALLLPAGTALGWLLARRRFFGKSLLDAVVNVPLVLPPVVTGYFLLQMLGPNSLIGGTLERLGLQVAFTWLAAMVAAAVVSLPLMVRAARVAIESVDPGLEEAARMLRSGELRTFFRVTLPLSRPGILAGAVLAFGRALGEFGATIIFAGNIAGETQTMPLAIFSYLNQVDGEQRARTLVIAAIVFAYASILLNEWFLRRFKHAHA